jgi:hypothetical protein
MIMRGPARRLAVALFAATAAPASMTASAGEIADKAALAETLLDRGYGAAALAAFDRAADAFWNAAPLQLRVITFAESVSGFGSYTPRPSPRFRNGETLRLYLEPVGYGFAPDGEGVRAAIAVDVEIKTPGGLILGSAEDFVRLEWQGRAPMREVHATIATPLPFLKPGEYRLVLTLRDQASPKTATVTLPFSVSG